MKPSKDHLRALRAENRKYGHAFVQIPPEQWQADPNDHTARYRNRVWRSRFFLVQEFVEEDGVIRLTINRTDVNRDGEWKDGITWQELQDIKREIGFGDHAAIEVFPPERYTVNVANMRHLWIMPAHINLPIPVWGLNR